MKGRVLPPQRAGILLRAGAYLDKLPPAVEGEGGHDTTFDAAVKITLGFDLTEDEALALMLAHFNPRCVPPWTEEELRQEVRDAHWAVRNTAGFLGWTEDELRDKVRNHRPREARG